MLIEAEVKAKVVGKVEMHTLHKMTNYFCIL